MAKEKRVVHRSHLGGLNFDQMAHDIFGPMRAQKPQTKKVHRVRKSNVRKSK